MSQAHVAVPRRTVLAGLASGALALPAIARGETPAAVQFGYFLGAPRAWVLGKVDGSYDRAVGAPTRWVSFTTGGQAMPLMVAGQVDIAVIGSSPIAAGLVGGAPIQVVGAPEIIATSERLIAKPEIKSMADLTGKAIAYAPGSTSQYACEAAIAAYKLDSRSIRRVSLAQNEIVAAWRRGDISAAYTGFWKDLLADGGHQLLASEDLRRFGCFVWNSTVVRTEFVQRYPATVVAVLKAIDASIGRYKADPEAASAALAKEMAAPVERARDVMAGLSYPTLREQATSDWLGSGANGSESRLVTALHSTAEFLGGIGEISRSRIPASFAGAVNTAILSQAAAST